MLDEDRAFSLTSFTPREVKAAGSVLSQGDFPRSAAPEPSAASSSCVTEAVWAWAPCSRAGGRCLRNTAHVSLFLIKHRENVS